MDIKDKLHLMDEIKATNEAREKEFLAKENTSGKHWIIDYSAILEDGTMIESGEGETQRLIIFSSNVSGALGYANAYLTEEAEKQHWKAWEIWNIGIVDGEEIF